LQGNVAPDLRQVAMVNSRS